MERDLLVPKQKNNAQMGREAIGVEKSTKYWKN